MIGEKSSAISVICGRRFATFKTLFAHSCTLLALHKPTLFDRATSSKKGSLIRMNSGIHACACICFERRKTSISHCGKENFPPRWEIFRYETGYLFGIALKPFPAPGKGLTSTKIVFPPEPKLINNGSIWIMIEQNNSLKAFIQTLRNFNSDDLFIEILNESWMVWSHQAIDKDLKNGEQYSYLLCSFGHYLSSLIVAYGNPQSRWLCTKTDICRLLSSFLDIEESFTANVNNFEIYFLTLSDHFKTSKNSDLLPFISLNVMQSIHLDGLMSRSLSQQWYLRSLHGRGSSRNLKIFEVFYKMIDSNLKTKVDSYLRMPPLNAARALYAIVAYLSNSIDNTKHGYLNTSKLKSNETLADEIDLRAGDVLLIAERICWTQDELKNYLDQRIQWGSEDAKYFESPFIYKPLLRIETPDNDVLYACPSPWALKSKLQNFFSDFFIDLKEDKSSNLPEMLRTFWGEAFHRFATELTIEILGENIKVIQPTRGAGASPEKFADLIIIEQDIALIIEFKTTIGSAKDRSYFSPKSIAEIMDKQITALKQCHLTKSHFKTYAPDIDVTKFCYLVVTLSPEIMESSFLHSINKKTDYFDKAEFSPFDIIDFDDYETLIACYSPKEIHELVSTKFAKIKINNYEGVRDAYKRKPGFKIPIYEEIDERILPGRKPRDFSEDYD